MTCREITLSFEGKSISLGFFSGVAQGESNSAANVGAGAGVFRDKVGAVLNLRSLTGTGGVVVTENADEINIDTALSAGDVVGPAGATDNAPAVFDGVTGKLIKEPDAAVDYLGQEISNVGNVDGRDVSADGSTLDGHTSGITNIGNAVTTHISDLANPHATDVGNLIAGTLAELNAAISDANVDDDGDPRDPNAHAASHEDAGSDEINVGGLAGLLNDAQTPLAHVSTHEDGGADELDVTDLTGLLADNQTPLAHAASHSDAGSDEIDAADLSSGSATGGHVLAADGVGGNAYSAAIPAAHASTHQNGGADEISVAGLSGELADPQPVKTHDLAGSDHGSATLAQLNAKVSDATLIDTLDARLSDARAPTGAASGDLGGTYPSPTVDDGADGTAIHDDVAGEISAITAKTVVVKDDLLIIEDSAAANAKKSLALEDLVQPYGQLVSENWNGGTLTLTLASPTYYKLNQWRTVGPALRTTPSLATDDITILEAGMYAIDVSMSAVLTVDENYQMAIFKNGFTTGQSIRMSAPNTAQATDIVASSVSGLVRCAVSDIISVNVRCLTAAGTTWRSRDNQLRVVRIGP